MCLVVATNLDLGRPIKYKGAPMKFIFLSLFAFSLSVSARTVSKCFNSSKLKGKDNLQSLFRSQKYEDFKVSFHGLCEAHIDRLSCKVEKVNTDQVEKKMKELTHKDVCAEVFRVPAEKSEELYFMTDKK